MIMKYDDRIISGLSWVCQAGKPVLIPSAAVHPIRLGYILQSSNVVKNLTDVTPEPGMNYDSIYHS